MGKYRPASLLKINFEYLKATSKKVAFLISLSPYIVLENSAKSTCVINKKSVPLHPILLNIMSNPFISEKTLLQRWKN
jgi:hypothetical protein